MIIGRYWFSIILEIRQQSIIIVKNSKLREKITNHERGISKFNINLRFTKYKIIAVLSAPNYFYYRIVSVCRNLNKLFIVFY